MAAKMITLESVIVLFLVFVDDVVYNLIIRPEIAILSINGLI
jgi:hypothetical protein